MSQRAYPLSKELSTSDVLAGWAQQVTSSLQLTHICEITYFYFIKLGITALRQAPSPEQVDLGS